MKEFTVKDLKDNIYFSEPVYLDEKFILLTPDVPMTTELKDRLAKWNFPHVSSEGEVTEAVVDMAGPSRSGAPAGIAQSLEDEEKKKDSISFFKKTVETIENAFTQYKLKDELRILSVTDTVKEIMTELKSNRRFVLSLDDSDSPAKTYLATQAVKTAILALAIGDYIKLPPFKQIDLGSAALLHEIGLLKIPERLYLTDKPLNPQEKKALTAHPVLGLRILKGASFPIPVCQAVLEHNERLDGSGSPRGITGDKISLYGKILAVASSYNAATSKRPYKASIDGHSGLMDLIKDAGKRYDEKVLASLVYTLSLYPIGTQVFMSNGALGVVVKSNPKNPKYPVVKLLIDENGNAYGNQPVVQTRDGDEVFISRSLNREEMDKVKRAGLVSEGPTVTLD